MTVAQTIQSIIREHLTKNNGVALGQCLTAVGWVGGTVPEMKEEDGLIELSMADVAGGGIAVGLALAGRRPIYIVRYQGFQWYNAAPLVNYAAKSKEMWGIPCPVFIRSIAMDGAIGPVAGSSHHSLFTRMPGIPVYAPMTPKEYQLIWNYFLSHDDPVYVSEHRRSFVVSEEMPDRINADADITLFGISATRLNMIEAEKQLRKMKIRCNLVHLTWLKPFPITDSIRRALSGSRNGGVVLDGDFENGAAKCIAYDMMQVVRKPVRVLGLEERTAGFAPQHDNLPPTAEKIVSIVRHVTQNSGE